MMKKLLLTLIFLFGTGGQIHAGGADDPLVTMLLMDQFEIRNNDERSRVWEGIFWIGYDLDKLYLYSSGEATSDGLESSQNTLLYSRAIAPFWDVQIGIAYDKNSGASRTWGEIAMMGLAPYYFETNAALLLNDKGNIGLRLKTEYEIHFTQKLILTPSLEADLYTKSDPEMQLGSGLSSIEAGLRLRYEIKREFAPYIGVNWERTFGKTRDYNSINEIDALIGVRFWF